MFYCEYILGNKLKEMGRVRYGCGKNLFEGNIQFVAEELNSIKYGGWLKANEAVCFSCLGECRQLNIYYIDMI